MKAQPESNRNGQVPEVVLTFDIDWAHEDVISDVVRVLDEARVGATFFATHPSHVLANLHDRHEIGIHPNFNPLLVGQRGDAREIIGALKAAYPSARGSRSHSLVQGTPIFDFLAEAGLEYDCSLLLPYHLGLAPHRLPNGLVRIPYFWEDDVHFEYGKSFAMSSIQLDPTRPNIFDFHPVHVFLNTESKARYATAKPDYHDPVALREHRNLDAPGARTLLNELLSAINGGLLRWGQIGDQLGDMS